jgi:hypothetical protein
LLPPIAVSLWLEVFRHLAQLMSGDDVGEILVTEGLYQAVYPYSAETISIVTILVKLSVYVNFVIIPLFIVYLLHQKFIRIVFLANVIKNSQSNHPSD